MERWGMGRCAFVMGKGGWSKVSKSITPKPENSTSSKASMLFREQGGQYRKSMSREITVFFGEEETGGNHFLKVFDPLSMCI